MALEGGAAELQWVVRDTTQRARKCNDVGIAYIRLSIVRSTEDGDEDLCLRPDIDVGRCTFECSVGRGDTPFKIPEGWYRFGLSVLDEERREISAEKVNIPPPIFRRVLHGEMLDLGVWQITVNLP